MVVNKESTMNGRGISELDQYLVWDLADGQLSGEPLVQAVQRVAEDRTCASAWQLHHLVGDVMRSGELAARGLNLDFCDRVLARLEKEGPSSTLIHAHTDEVDLVNAVPVVAARGPAANAWNWSMVSGMASLVIALSAAWFFGGEWSAFTPEPKISELGPKILAAPPGTGQVEPQIMIRDPRLDELLAAHKQLGGISALQKPAGFLRNAAFEEGVRPDAGYRK